MTSQFKTFFLLVLLSGILICIGGVLGGMGGVIIATVLALLINLTSYWYSDSIILKMYNAQPITQEDAPLLYTSLQTMAYKANIPMPSLYLIEESIPNAFATGRSPEHGVIVLTKGLLTLLTPEEICAVMGHELGHIANRDTLIQTITAIIASSIVSLANMLQFTALFGSRSSDSEGNTNGIHMLILSILAPLAATLIQFAISRSREYLADDTGSDFHGNPNDLASALYKIQEYAQRGHLQATDATAHLFIISPLSSQGLHSLFSTHPPTEERIKRLQAKAHK
ncbi:MAG: M48 family metalloprotease [Desulfovibrionaceae bacterium]|nr:M48 family metalloprotease [Desulfovibrionaceae bacterium]